MKKRPATFRWAMHPFVTNQHLVGHGQFRSMCGIDIRGLGRWAAIDGDCIQKCKRCVDIEKQNIPLCVTTVASDDDRDDRDRCPACGWHGGCHRQDCR